MGKDRIIDKALESIMSYIPDKEKENIIRLMLENLFLSGQIETIKDLS